MAERIPYPFRGGKMGLMGEKALVRCGEHTDLTAMLRRQASVLATPCGVFAT
jgi:hypothetical protein